MVVATDSRGGCGVLGDFFKKKILLLVQRVFLKFRRLKTRLH